MSFLRWSSTSSGSNSFWGAIIRLKPFGDVDGLVLLIKHKSHLPNWRQRWCTPALKIKPAIKLLEENAPCVQYVGLRADEEERAGIYGDIAGTTQRYPLREWGWGLEDVIDFLAERGIRVPKRTDCVFCYGQRLIEWKRLWQEHPDIYQQGVDLEEMTGHTFRSAGRDTWPAALKDLRKLFEEGAMVRGEVRPGCLQLSLWDQLDDDQQPCRVCRM